MNPIIPTVFSADPSVHVWPGDDRIWIYASHDQPGTNTHDSMVSYHVFSSTDMVHWTDYGSVFHLKDVSWAISQMWAIDAVKWKGLYYMVYCAIEKNSGMFKTGLATSPLPEGPFQDIGFIEGVDNGQDPALFVDEDGTPYLFWGQLGVCFGCRLTDDLRSAVRGTIVDLTKQLTWVFEGPFVHKFRGKYYLSYPGLYQNNWPEIMYYATADHPLGPYSFRGEYIPFFEGQAGTNHGSIVEYQGRWYAFYHSMWETGISECRSLMCDYLEYDEEGQIKPIIPSRIGVAAPGCKSGASRVTLMLGAETAPLARGTHHGVSVETTIPGYTGRGYVTGMDKKYTGVTVMAQSGRDMDYRLRIRYCAPKAAEKLKVMVNTTTLLEDAREQNPRWDKHIPAPQASEWAELDCGIISLKAGDNHIKAYTWDGSAGGLAIDCFLLDPLVES